jgi:hypothetical protein
MKKINAYKFWYKVFLIIGFYGLLDIIVGVFLKQSGIGPEIDNGLTIMIARIFKYLFGTSVATSFILPLIIISSTWFIWLIISEIFRRKIKKLEWKDGITNTTEAQKLNYIIKL